MAGLINTDDADVVDVNVGVGVVDLDGVFVPESKALISMTVEPVEAVEAAEAVEADALPVGEYLSLKTLI